MNEPRRLVDEGANHPELRRLLRGARPPRALDTPTFERSRRRVTALGAVPAALGVLVWIKHAALGAVLGVTLAAAATAPRWLAPRENVATPPASAVTRNEAPVRVRPPPTLQRSLPEPIAIPEATSARAPALTPAPAPSSDGGLSMELSLLERARSELERRPGSSLVLLSRHEREFPRGALSLEREFLTISALVRLGRRTEAETRASALRSRSPGSLYERRLDAIFGDAGAR